MVICPIDQTDGDFHNDHTLRFKFYIWEHLKLKSKLKLSNMYAYVNLLHNICIYAYMYTYTIPEHSLSPYSSEIIIPTLARYSRVSLAMGAAPV